MASLRKLMTDVAEIAGKLFLQHGSAAPTWIGQKPNGELIPIVTPFTDDDRSKSDARRQAQRAFAQHDVIRLVMFCEAWMSFADGEALKQPNPTIPRPDVDPDRQEVLYFQGEEHSGLNLLGTRRILRPEHGPARLMPLKIQTGTRTGRLAGVLTPRDELPEGYNLPRFTK